MIFVIYILVTQIKKIIQTEKHEELKMISSSIKDTMIKHPEMKEKILTQMFNSISKKISKRPTWVSFITIIILIEILLSVAKLHNVYTLQVKLFFNISKKCRTF